MKFSYSILFFLSAQSIKVKVHKKTIRTVLINSKMIDVKTIFDCLRMCNNSTDCESCSYSFSRQECSLSNYSLNNIVYPAFTEYTHETDITLTKLEDESHPNC